MIASNRTSAADEAGVLAAVRSGLNNIEAGKAFGVSEATVRRIRARDVKSSVVVPGVHYFDKKVSTLNWRDTIPLIQQMQEMKESSSRYQKRATIKIGDGTSPVALMFLSDMHIGSIGADYAAFLELTDIIINTPGLYIVIGGDEVEMACRLRSVFEVCAQVLDPEVQEEFLAQWLQEIKHKVVIALYGNHATDRQEQMVGSSSIAQVLAKEVVFFNGIGHADLIVGDITYKGAFAHKFRGATGRDPAAGCKNYIKNEYPDADFAMQGDIHKPKIEVYQDGGRTRSAMVAGSLHLNSGFATRNFSIQSSSAFPVMVLRHDVKAFTPFFSVQDWLAVTGGKLA